MTVMRRLGDPVVERAWSYRLQASAATTSRACGARKPGFARRRVRERGRAGAPDADPAPKANAYAERWVQTVRAECLNWTLVLGRRHLLRLLRGYVRHYNQQRPHRSLALAVPEPEAGERKSPHVNPPEVERRDVLGGLIHEYHEVAA